MIRSRFVAFFLILPSLVYASFSPPSTQYGPTPTIQRRQVNQVQPTDAPAVGANGDPSTPSQIREPPLQRAQQQRNPRLQQLPPQLYELLRDTIAFLPIPPTQTDAAFSVTCTGDLPAGTDLSPNLNPAIYNPIFYKDLTDLCAFHGSSIEFEGTQTSLNVGCACRSPNLAPFSFCWPPLLSNIALYQISQLVDYCHSHCRCIQPVHLAPYSRRIPVWSAGDIRVFKGRGDNDLWVQKKLKSGLYQNTYVKTDGTVNGDWTSGFSLSSAEARIRRKQRLLQLSREIVEAKARSSPDSFSSPLLPPSSLICSGTCDASGGFRCTGQDCRCFANSVGMGLWDVHGCGALGLTGLGSLRGKRDVEHWACPCNATYVSEACCHSDTGIVWEVKEAWLGEMV